MAGLIADKDQRPFPHPYIAHELHISEDLLESTLAKCKDETRISEDEHGIHITNWEFYQSEYDRQKKYRKKFEPIDPAKYTKGKYGHLVQT